MKTASRLSSALASRLQEIGIPITMVFFPPASECADRAGLNATQSALHESQHLIAAAAAVKGTERFADRSRNAYSSEQQFTPFVVSLVVADARCLTLILSKFKQTLRAEWPGSHVPRSGFQLCF